MHVISSDLIAPALKTKRHYNSFSPRTGFFIPLADVLHGWFDHDHDYTLSEQQKNLSDQFIKVRFLRCVRLFLFFLLPSLAGSNGTCFAESGVCGPPLPKIDGASGARSI
jgi:hypothetical protein